ncbi:probable dolichyl-diphosphooligosaccharide--protein glycosyltransferase subunit 3 [Argentina anserina]|uniref:probable dolichyl-diphosphooligosaccharide--protein glycosyltransferase subunit 3 n=1 Tax=Argentina anserina TaxID=57926 RepID=UPI0021767D1A|nr:probable dolichyl-diphosphooligosaccharide--protein glycosyltransferase subunit 3 [Potentilla anserina]
MSYGLPKSQQSTLKNPSLLLLPHKIRNPKISSSAKMRRTMSPIPKLPLLLLLCSLLSLAAADSDLVSELQSLQSRSPSGVIRLTDHTVARFLTSAAAARRPYSLLIFFDAAKLHDKPELHLSDLRREFTLVAASFISNNAASSKLFFADIEFQDSQASFAQFGVNSLPHIRLVGPAHSPKDSVQMEQGDFSRLAESMSEFIESKTKLTVGPIHRPPMFSRNQIILAVMAFLIWTPFIVKKILTGKTLVHDPRVWLSGAVFVYFFSVSGAMHNIIRKMPMFLADRNDPNKLIFFYQGSGMQLGTEGFAIGFLYTIVGLLLAFSTRVLVRVRNLNVQRVVMLAALVVSFWAVKKVVYLDNWKTGYGIHAFWPTSWK